MTRDEAAWAIVRDLAKVEEYEILEDCHICIFCRAYRQSFGPPTEPEQQDHADSCAWAHAVELVREAGG